MRDCRTIYLRFKISFVGNPCQRKSVALASQNAMATIDFWEIKWSPGFNGWQGAVKLKKNKSVSVGLGIQDSPVSNAFTFSGRFLHSEAKSVGVRRSRRFRSSLTRMGPAKLDRVLVFLQDAPNETLFSVCANGWR
jgi:hypothetical protein